MNDNTTLILITHNHKDYIDTNYHKLLEYKKHHHNIIEIIILDNASKDGTREYLQNYNPAEFKIIFFDNELSNKTCEITAIQQSTTENIIIIEAELYHRLHQLKHIIKKLHKADLILPNRFSPDSKSNALFDSLMKKVTLEIFAGYICKDPFNTLKAFKKSKILPLIQETTNKFYWLETIKKARLKGYKINEPSTHYKKDNPKENILKTNLQELIKIRKERI